MVAYQYLLAIVLLNFVTAAVDPDAFQRALDALPGLCQDGVNATGVPGLSVAVVLDGQVRYTGGFGVKEIGKDEPVSADTVFQLASVSKPISSTIVAAIVSEGAITWADKTNSPKVIAEYSDPYVTADLRLSDGFTHRSGLIGTAGDDLEMFGFTREAIFARMKSLPPSGPFRITYSYSNYALTLAAQAASDAVGKSWDDAAQHYLYDPLGMSVTSSRYSDFLSRSDRSSLHMPSTGNTSQLWTPAPPRTPDAQAPAGGVSSSANDLVKWLQLHLDLGRFGDTQIISQEAINETRVPQIVRGLTPIINQTGFYALGWDIDYEDGKIWQSHAGAFSQGARTLVKMNVDDGIGILILANAFPTGIPEGIADTFFDLVYYGESRRDYVTLWNDAYSIFDQPPSPYLSGKPENADPMLSTDAYTGQYYNGYAGVAEVSPGAASDELVLCFPGSSDSKFTLKHWSRDTFYVSELDYDPGAGVTFAVGGDGISMSMTVDDFNFGGNVLTRLQPGQSAP